MKIAITTEQHDEIQKEIYRLCLVRESSKDIDPTGRIYLDDLIDELEEVLKSQEIEIRVQY